MADESSEPISATTEAALAVALTRAAGAAVTVRAMRRLAGGASMESWAVDVTCRGEELALVVRRDMGANMFHGALTRAQEFAMLGAAQASGVRAPKPIWLCADDPRPFFAMQRLAGESVGRRVVRVPELATARMHLADDMARQLAAIHRIDRTAVPFLTGPRDGETGGAMALRIIRETIDALRIDHAAWEFGWRWLSRHEPAPSGETTVLHGDFRIGNLLVTPDGLSGVLDWEFAHIGDPLDDLAWPLLRDWRFERDDLHVGGVGTLDAYLAAYESARGRRVDRAALRWWEILGNLRWAVFCRAQADRHLRGADRSVELASLGRKAAEMDWEMLSCIRAEESR